jgi:hypothetical protein
MTALLLQPTGNPSQYEVIAAEHGVGRIALYSALRGHRKPWVWSIDLAFSARRERVHGFESTREAAMKAFTNAWEGEGLTSDER